MRLAVGERGVDAVRVFCIGRNYVEHVRELGNQILATPMIFMKPVTSLVTAGAPVRFPEHASDLHHEAELVVVLGRSPDPESAQGPGWDDVAGVGLGLDLTLRGLQAELKAKGLPWELAKSFDDSAPLGPLVAPATLPDPDRLRFECRVNGQLRQVADTRLMIFPVPQLLAAIARAWRLRAGDVVFTGTPAGVGSLERGDVVELSGDGLGEARWQIGEALDR